MSQTNKWIVSIMRRVQGELVRKEVVVDSLDNILETLKDESYNLSEDMLHLSIDRYYGERKPVGELCESIVSTN